MRAIHTRQSPISAVIQRHGDTVVHKHTFESVNRFWFDAPRDPPLVMLRDKIDDNNRLLDGQMNVHEDFLALFIVQHGRGKHIVNGVPYELSRGDVYTIGIGSYHQYMHCENLDIDGLYFRPNFLDPEVTRVLVRQPALRPLLMPGPQGEVGIGGGGGRWKHISPQGLSDINSNLKELKSEWTTPTEVGRLLTRPLFLRFIIHLSRLENTLTLSDDAPTQATSTADVVACALEIIESGFTQTVRVEDIARTACVSPDWLTRLFTNATGRTPREYVRYLRIERAKSLLMSTLDSVTEVAGKSGFGDSAYFARAFREETGMTPREFRERYHGS